MVEFLSSEQQIADLQRELAARDATIAAQAAAVAEATVIKVQLTTALLEIEHIKIQLATLRRQRYGQSSEKLDSDIAQLEMRLEDFGKRCLIDAFRGRGWVLDTGRHGSRNHF